MNTKNISIAIAILVVAGALGWYALSAGKTTPTGSNNTSDTVAIVNGENITRAELDSAESRIAAQQGASATTTAQKAQLQSAALDSLVAQKLLLQAAQAAGVTASSTEVDSQMAAAKAQFGTSTESYNKALVAAGMTEESLRTQITENLVMQSYLNQKLNLNAVTVSDAEIQTAYDQATSGKTGAPPLSQVRDQVKQSVLQQKQQQLIGAYVAQLKTDGNVQILISTSTPAAS